MTTPTKCHTCDFSRILHHPSGSTVCCCLRFLSAMRADQNHAHSVGSDMWAYLCARAKAGQLEDYGVGGRDVVTSALISVPSRPDRDGWHYVLSKLPAQQPRACATRSAARLQCDLPRPRGVGTATATTAMAVPLFLLYTCAVNITIIPLSPNIAL